MNDFITIPQLYHYIDERTCKSLSSDRNSPEGNMANLQAVMDSCAARVITFLTGRVTIPPANATAVLFLRGLIADLTHLRLYGRRSDAPKPVVEAAKVAEDWLRDFMTGLVMLPGESGIVPILHKSMSLTGDSKFSHVLGQSPTSTETDGQ